MTPVIRIYLDEPSITILNASKQHVHNKCHILSLKQIPRDLKTYLHFCNRKGPRQCTNTANWRLRWKKGGRFFTQNWTLSETLQISHVVFIRCVKECSVCFLAEVCLVFEVLRMQKTCILWSRQHVTAKTVISLKIKQNIDLLQRATLKSIHFR